MSIARATTTELGVVIAAGLVYLVVRELTEGSAGVAIANARRLVEVEAWLGIGWERSVQSMALNNENVGELANWIYVWGHWPVIAAAAIGLFALRRDRYHLLRNSVICSGLLGCVFFATVPMAPPRLAGGGFVDTVSAASGYHETFQPPDYTNLFAAMPSLHFGWNLLLGIVLFTTTRLLVVRIVALAMPLAMAFAVVATANHWVLDIFVGLLVVLVGLVVAHRLQRHPKSDPEEPRQLP
jgi:hypothetical protein